MDRFNKIWTTALAAGLTAIGLILILQLSDPLNFGVAAFSIQPVVGLFVYAAVFVAMVAASFLFHIIAHEGGHCIGGLLSGYGFASFRVFNIMIVKRDGKYQRKKFHLVGTGGQCLMAPPQPYRPDYPYKLYNLAGGLSNLLISAVCILLSVPVVKGILELQSPNQTQSATVGFSSIWPLFILFPLIVAGIFCGVTNLVPMIIGGVANDGWNLAHLGKDGEARRILWLLLDVMAIINRGGQFRDMPEEWFSPADQTAPAAPSASTAPAAPDYSNTFQVALGVYRFNYLEDTGRLPEAAELARQILAAGDRVTMLYRFELMCESIFLELIGERRLDRVERLYTPELERYIRMTDSYPHRQRLHYAMAMLYEYDEAAATKALERFKKACQTYPNDGEISSEWELIGLVDCKLAEVKTLEAEGKIQEDEKGQPH